MSDRPDAGTPTVRERPQRNLALELVRATESAAIVAARHTDPGDREAAGPAAAGAMGLVLQTLEMDGVIVVGEGEKGVAPRLYHGQAIGSGRPPAVDVAVDPIEGTPARALGRPNTLSVAALAERWSMWQPGPSVYVEQIAVGRAARDAIDLRLRPADNLRRIAATRGCRVQDLTVFVLDKPRHAGLVRELSEAGAQVRLNTGGFILGAMLAALPDAGVDVMISIGRASEAVLAAAAVVALDGALQIRRAPQSEAEQAAVQAALGPRASEVLAASDLVRSDDVFFAATGLTDGGLLRGVQFGRDGVTTESVVMRARSGTVRYVRAIHRLDKLMRFSQIDYTGQGRP